MSAVLDDDEPQRAEVVAGLQPEHPKMGLVRRTQRGDTKARSELMEYWFELGQALLPRLARRGLSDEDMQDIIVNALIKAVEMAEEGKVRNNPDGLYVHLLRDQIAKKQKHEVHVSELIAAAKSGSPNGMGWWSRVSDEGQVLRQIPIRDALNRLSESVSQLLLRVCGEGMKYAEAAEELGINPRTIDRHIKNARQEFVDLYDGPGPERM